MMAHQRFLMEQEIMQVLWQVHWQKQTRNRHRSLLRKEEEAAQIREGQERVESGKGCREGRAGKNSRAGVFSRQLRIQRKKLQKKQKPKRLAKRQEVVNFALQFEEILMLLARTSLTNSADCSGFVMSVLPISVTVFHVAAAQCEASTKKDISQQARRSQ